MHAIRRGTQGMRALILVWCLLGVVASADAALSVVGGLPRKASLGFRTDAAPAGLAVQALDLTSAAALAGLVDGDLITAVDGRGFDRPLDGQALLENLRGGVATRLAILRDGRASSIRFTPTASSLENIAGVQTRYGSVTVGNGTMLRTLIAHRSSLAGPLPALLFTQWVSCGSLEYRKGSNSLEILARLARDSGGALVRVERAGTGDSQGPACHQLDYDTELSHYIEAFDEVLRSDPSLDRERVVVLGSSLGSTLAPLVARALEERGHRIAGVAVNGGGALTYFERMIAFDRFYLERRPAEVQPADIDAQLLPLFQFQVEYLLKGRSPDDIVRDGPAMAKARANVRGLGDGEHYGRPYAYHQQAARRNFLAAWTSLREARVLAVHGEFDQFEGRHGHELIALMVNRVRPGAARFVALPFIDHDNDLHPTLESAYAFSERGVPGIEIYLQTVLDWLWSELDFRKPG